MKSYSFLYTNADDVDETITVRSRLRIAFVNKKGLSKIRNDQALTLTTSLNQLGEDKSVRCTLSMHANDKFYIESARAAQSGDGVTCAWSEELMAKLVKGKAELSLSVSERRTFANGMGSASFSYIAPMTIVTIR